MNVALQIRDVPEQVRDILARRAAEAGMSLQKYLLDLVVRDAGQTRNVDLLRSIRPTGSAGDVVALIAADREERMRQILEAIE